MIRHSVEGARVVKDRRGEQSPTVYLGPDAKKICHNRVNGRSFPEAPADSWRVVAAFQGCVPGMERAEKGGAGLLQQQRRQFQVLICDTPGGVFPSHQIRDNVLRTL